MWVDTGVTDGRINAPAPHTTRCGARCRPSSGVSDFRFRVLFNFHANICACGMRNSQFWYNIWFLCAPGCRPNILAHPHIQYFVCIFITHIGPFAFVRFRSRHWKLNKFPLPLQKNIFISFLLFGVPLPIWVYTAHNNSQGVGSNAPNNSFPTFSRRHSGK